MIVIKRIYDPASRTDGKRILVDRLWPRGTKKDEAAIDDQLKDIRPSTGLRKSFGCSFRQKMWNITIPSC